MAVVEISQAEAHLIAIQIAQRDKKELPKIPDIDWRSALKHIAQWNFDTAMEQAVIVMGDEEDILPDDFAQGVALYTAQRVDDLLEHVFIDDKISALLTSDDVPCQVFLQIRDGIDGFVLPLSDAKALVRNGLPFAKKVIDSLSLDGEYPSKLSDAQMVELFEYSIEHHVSPEVWFDAGLDPAKYFGGNTYIHQVLSCSAGAGVPREYAICVRESVSKMLEGNPQLADLVDEHGISSQVLLDTLLVSLLAVS